MNTLSVTILSAILMNASHSCLSEGKPAVSLHNDFRINCTGIRTDRKLLLASTVPHQKLLSYFFIWIILTMFIMIQAY